MTKLITAIICLITLGFNLQAAEDSDSKWQGLTHQGESLLHEGKPQEAITSYLNPVIEQFASLNTPDAPQVYCARNGTETLFYLMQAAVLSESKAAGSEIPEIWGNRFAQKKNDVQVLPQFWAEAFFLKAYALIDLGKVEQARACLETAVGLSPLNSKYLAELGHSYQIEKNWDMAMQAYKAAAADAVHYSNADQQEFDQARAWRGEGYILVELGKLEEAKAIYQKCIDLNANDKRSLAELNYIKGLESKNSSK